MYPVMAINLMVSLLMLMLLLLHCQLPSQVYLLTHLLPLMILFLSTTPLPQPGRKLQLQLLLCRGLKAKQVQLVLLVALAQLALKGKRVILALRVFRVFKA
tara:strand:- start:2680 stop:2982 length:303 start_codon:yes stop_codon:yes gene_type:complete